MTVASTAVGNISFAKVDSGTGTGSPFGLTVNTTGTTTFGDAVGAAGTGLASLTTNAGGTTAIAAAASARPGQTYGDSVTLGNDATIDRRHGHVQRHGDGGGKALTVSGNAVFGDAASDAVTGLSTLAVNGNTTVNTSTITSTASRPTPATSRSARQPARPR